MAVVDYAIQFNKAIEKKYAQELRSYALTQSNPQVQWLTAKTLRLPTLTTTGYKDHSRAFGGFAQGTSTNDWTSLELKFDRSVEFFIDPMDVDETNMVQSIANIQNVFEETQAIPEKDKYRFSKLFAEATEKGSTIKEVTLTIDNILQQFDELMEQFDEAGVPLEGRILYVTPFVKRLIKEVSDGARGIDAHSIRPIYRMIYNLDDVEIIVVQSDRMKTKYNFTEGAVADPTAKQMHMILVHPSAVVCRDRYSYIKVFTPGTDSRTADGYLYQNRNYHDLFVLETKFEGVAIVVEPTTEG